MTKQSKERIEPITFELWRDAEHGKLETQGDFMQTMLNRDLILREKLNEIITLLNKEEGK